MSGGLRRIKFCKSAPAPLHCIQVVIINLRNNAALHAVRLYKPEIESLLLVFFPVQNPAKNSVSSTISKLDAATAKQSSWKRPSTGACAADGAFPARVISDVRQM